MNRQTQVLHSMFRQVIYIPPLSARGTRNSQSSQTGNVIWIELVCPCAEPTSQEAKFNGDETRYVFLSLDHKK